MLFRLSNCIGICTPTPTEAIDFYQAKLNMTLENNTQNLELQAGPLTFFIDPGPTKTPILELITTDHDRARKHLQLLGCEETIWRGEGDTNMIVDPFGIRWSIYTDPTAFEPRDIQDFQDHPVKPKISIHTPFAHRAANFYADLLQTPLAQAPEANIIDSYNIRLRVEDALPLGPVLSLHPNIDLTTIDPRAKKADSIATDPYGVRWKHTPINPDNRAAISI